MANLAAMFGGGGSPMQTGGMGGAPVGGPSLPAQLQPGQGFPQENVMDQGMDRFLSPQAMGGGGGDQMMQLLMLLGLTGRAPGHPGAGASFLDAIKRRSLLMPPGNPGQFGGPMAQTGMGAGVGA
jgi:hypothetical protein